MNLQSIKNIFIKLGVDKSIVYSSGARIIQAVSGIVSIFFIAQFLSETEQGFYYTFGSIVAIQVFFELGLTTIITQYVAHERAGLNWRDSVNLEGDQRNHSRLAYLLKFSVKWYAIISIILFFMLLGAGFCFFGLYSPVEQNVNNVTWKTPWLLVCLGTSLNLFLSPLMSLISGLDRVKDVMKMRFYQQLIIPLTTWIGLMLGFRLYVIGIASIISVIYIIVYGVSTELGRILKNLWNISITHKVSYMKEIFPYQWKIALSWVSGYFIFQLFNPVLFAYSGPIVAGQMGMTMTALNGINAFSYSWINTKIPKFSIFIALKQYCQLDKIFNQTVKQMLFVCLFLLVVMLTGILGLRLLDLNLGDRFLPFIPMILLMGALILSQLVSAWATYLRCHKQEPFLLNSIVGAILCCLSTIILGRYYGVIGMTMGYFVIKIALTIWGYYIYKSCKHNWHRSTC